MNAIQKYTANSPMFANSPIRTTPRLRQLLQTSIYTIWKSHLSLEDE